ncbi:MAG: choice-of-anchor D domain-containing protein, partial [Candidatus Cloacimonetes bacterium]|nr:choice-of-anchor D domain-containing protein [Candidatus Cloacimonadota bacterium]MCK9243491.1 choice-of-anchor D domain-containing protein [Candidatus Cloacimonadota bacterium]
VFADVIIGAGTSSSYNYPIGTWNKWHRAAAIYTGTEINAGSGTITNLQLYCDVANTATAVPTKIYLKTTASTTLAGDTWANQIAGATLVFDATVTYNATGWFDFDITDTPYNASDNLEVLFESAIPNYSSPYVKWRYTSTTPSYQFIYAGSDTAAPTSLSTSYNRPNIKFVGISGVVYPEPTNHVTDFAAGTLAYTSIQLNWTGATGAQLPAGYLIQAIKGAGSYADVVDGTPVANDAVWTDDNAAINVAHALGANTHTFTGLTLNTPYEFKIWPYTNSLTDIDFKTDGTIPTVNASTMSTQEPIPYTQNFDSGTSLSAINWTGNMTISSTHGANGTNGLYKNMWSSSTSANAVSNPIGPLVADSQLMFDYRIVNYTGYPGTGTTLAGDNIQVQISTDDGVSFNTVYTIDSTNHITSNAFATVTIPLLTYDTQAVKIKFLCTWDAGDYYVDFDNVILRGTPSVAVFSLTPDVTTWDFGATMINTLATKQFTITNTGGGTLTVNSITPSGAYYSISENPSPVALGSGASANFTVQYAPTVVGASHTGSFVINDSRALTTVTLSGSCFDPTITSFPYTENFDAVTVPALPLNWSVTEGSTGASQHWKTTTSDSHGASAANSGDNFAYLYCYLASTDKNPYSLITPPIALDATAKRLSYYYWIGDNTVAEPLFVDVSSDLSSWTTLYTHDTSNTLAWFNNTVDLSAYASSTVYLRFRGVSNYSSNLCDLGIDDVVVEDIPSLPIFSLSPDVDTWDFGSTMINTLATKQFTITNTGGGTLTVSSITASGAYYSISDNPAPIDLGPGASANFTVQYAPTAVGASHTGSFVINDSRALTTVTLSGSCFDPTITSFSHTENFDGTWSGSPAAPLGWTVINANNDSYMWSQASTYITARSAPHTAHGMGNADDYLITPQIDLIGVDVRMKWWDIVESASYANSYKVLLSTTDPEIASFTVELADITCANTEWTEHTLNLDAYNGQTVYIAFYQYASAATYYGFGIDDFLLEEIPEGPVFVIDPIGKDFGKQEVGSSAEVVFTISNTGGADLEIAEGGISLSGTNPDQFGLGDIPYPLTITPGTNATITVSFEPTSEGLKSATLEIVDNTPSEKSIGKGAKATQIVDLSGEGVIFNTVPYAYGFSEGWGDWTVVNGTQTNKWHVGDPGIFGTNAAYISDDNGISWNYNTGSTSVVHFYQDINFPAETTDFKLKFDWLCNGEGVYTAWDYLRVYAVDTTVMPQAGTLLTSELGTYNLSGTLITDIQ